METMQSASLKLDEPTQLINETNRKYSSPVTAAQTQITLLLQKSQRGDHGAFDKLMNIVCPIIKNTLRKQGATADDADDILGTSMAIIFRVLTNGGFKTIQPGGFVNYFKKVAVNAWLHSRRKANLTTSLSFTDSATGEEMECNISDGSRPLTEQVENKYLYDFLIDLLEDVFVKGKQGAERARGEMEKRSFLYFYRDGMTQNEVFDTLKLQSSGIENMNPITRADINNWLSMGRSLKSLLKRLTDEHRELTDVLIDLHLGKLALPAKTESVLRMVYHDGSSLDSIAANLKSTTGEIKRDLMTGKRMLVDSLAQTIKGQLHNARTAC